MESCSPKTSKKHVVDVHTFLSIISIVSVTVFSVQTLVQQSAHADSGFMDSNAII